MTTDPRRQIAIIGVAETDRIGVVPDMSEIELHANSAHNAIADEGIDKKLINGIAAARRYPTAVVDHLGIVQTCVDGTGVGGCSFMIHVSHAVAALAAGY